MSNNRNPKMLNTFKSNFAFAFSPWQSFTWSFNKCIWIEHSFPSMERTCEVMAVSKRTDDPWPEGDSLALEKASHRKGDCLPWMWFRPRSALSQFCSLLFPISSLIMMAHARLWKHASWKVTHVSWMRHSHSFTELLCFPFPQAM